MPLNSFFLGKPLMDSQPASWRAPFPQLCLLWLLGFILSLAATIFSRGKVDGHNVPMGIPLTQASLLAKAALTFFLAIPWALWSWKVLHVGTKLWRPADFFCVGALGCIVWVTCIVELSLRHWPTSAVAIVSTSVLGVVISATAALVAVKSVITCISLKVPEAQQLETGMAKLAFLSFSLASLYSGYSEPVVQRANIHIPGLSLAADGYTICMLSDLHAGPVTGRDVLAALTTRILNLDCDTAVLNGDIAEGTVEERRSEMEALLPVKKVRDGAFYVPGNHEYYNFDSPLGNQGESRAWTEWWDAHGVRSLNNSHVTIQRASGALLALAGVDDILGFPNLSLALAGCNSTMVPIILMAHRPFPHIYVASEAGVTLQLSGHTHGGQLWPAQLPTKFANKGFLSGLYAVGSTQLYVGEGSVSSYMTRLRLFTRSEISQIVLHSKPVAPGMAWRPAYCGLCLSWMLVGTVLVSFTTYVMQGVRQVVKDRFIGNSRHAPFEEGAEAALLVSKPCGDNALKIA